MRKISHKLILLITVVIALTLASIWIYNSYFLEDVYLKSRIEILQNSASEIDLIYKSNDAEALENYIDEILIEKNINSHISTIKGELVFTSQSMMKGRGHMNNRRVISQADLKRILSNGEAITTIRQGNNNTEMLAYSMVMGDQDAIITLTVLLEPINKTIEIMKTQLLYISIILLIVTISIGAFIARVFLKPIEKLNYAVNQIAVGNMEERVEVTTRDEIGELSQNFNEMAEKLNRVELLRKELISNVSHDLRTPLGLIKGYAEMIRDIHADNPEKTNEDLNIIIEESDRLSEMVNEILDSSEFKSGYIELKREDFDLALLIDASFEKYKIKALEKEIGFSLSLENQNVYINADPIRLQQVLDNLIANAINFTESGGSIDLKVYEKDKKIRVEINDNGIGMDSEELKYIWDRFYKGEKNKDSTINSGIGLSIVKNILTAHDFEFGVNSELDKGTSFFILIPKKE